MAEHGGRHGQDAQRRPGDEKGEQHQHQRAAQFVAEEKVQVDFLRILQRETEKQDEQDESCEGGNEFHRVGLAVGDAKAQCRISASLFQS